MRIAMGHLESAKCIGGLSATSSLIPPKLYHLILPYPFKPHRGLSRVKRLAEDVRCTVWRDVCERHREFYLQRVEKWPEPVRNKTNLRATPTRSPNVVRKFSSTKCPAVLSFLPYAQLSLAFPRRKNALFLVVTRITRSPPRARRLAKSRGSSRSWQRSINHAPAVLHHF